MLGCYVVYKEAKHHELYRLRAEFDALHEKHEEVITDAAKTDPEMLDYFKGELVGIDEALDILKKEDADCDLIQEIEDDLRKIKEKVAGVFGK